MLLFALSFTSLLIWASLFSLAGASPIGSEFRGGTARTQVATGSYHSLFLRSDGSVWASGAKSSFVGALGSGYAGIPVNVTTPERVCAPIASPSMASAPCPSGPYLEDVVQIAAGNRSSYALTAKGEVYAWGDNTNKQLGRDTSTQSSNRPVKVCKTASCLSSLDGVAAVASGWNNAFVLLDDGTAWSWGKGGAQLGNGSNGVDIGLPSQVCASGVKTTATTGCGGSYLSDITSIESEVKFSYATTADGNLHAWGVNDDLRMGATQSDYSTKPVQISGVSNVVAAASAPWHGMALQANGVPFAWGKGSYSYGGGASYKLGRADSNDSSTPVRPCAVGSTGVGAACSSFVSNVVDIDTSYNTSIVLFGNGTMAGWGGNYYGTIGNSHSNSDGIQNEPRASTTCRRSADGDCSVALSNIIDIAMAVGTDSDTNYDRSEGVFAVHANGSASAWGLNNEGGLGIGSVSSDPNPRAIEVLLNLNVAPSIDGNIIQVDGGSKHTIALTADGDVYSSGANNFGQLGIGSTQGKLRFTKVTGLSNIKQIAAGENHSLALASNGTVYAWGRGTLGQLGNGFSLNSSTPVQVTSLPSSATNAVTSIAAGGDTSMARLADGTVRAWGAGSRGQLGTGGNSNSNTPVVTFGLGNVVEVAMGKATGIARLGDGTVKAWGAGTLGQLGNGSASDATTSVVVKEVGGVGNLARINRIAAAGDHIVARRADGTVVTWGSGVKGQLGNDSPPSVQSVPVTVSKIGGSGGSLGHVTSIAAGEASSYARLGDGRIVAWGEGSRGELGNGAAPSATTFPIIVNKVGGGGQLDSVRRVDAGYQHVFAQLGNGMSVDWGADDSGPLARCTTGDSLYPVMVSNAYASCGPREPTSLMQYQHNGTTPIVWGDQSANGGYLDTQVEFKFTVTDDDAGQTLTPYVEVQPVGTPFSGVCGTISSNVFSGNSVSAPVAGVGVTASVRVGSLDDDTNYRWRACTVDQSALRSAWTSAADSHANGRDFRVEYPAPSLSIEVGDEIQEIDGIMKEENVAFVIDVNVNNSDPDGYQLLARTDDDINAATCISAYCDGSDVVPHWRGVGDLDWNPTLWSAVDSRARAGITVLKASGAAPGSARRMMQWGASSVALPTAWSDSNYAAGNDNGSDRLLHDHPAPTSASGDNIQVAWRFASGNVKAGEYRTVISLTAIPHP